LRSDPCSRPRRPGNGSARQRLLRADPTPQLSAPAPASYRRVARRDRFHHPVPEVTQVTNRRHPGRQLTPQSLSDHRVQLIVAESGDAIQGTHLAVRNKMNMGVDEPCASGRRRARWVWGSGLGRVTVRFETKDTPPGPVWTFASDGSCAPSIMDLSCREAGCRISQSRTPPRTARSAAGIAPSGADRPLLHSVM